MIRLSAIAVATTNPDVVYVGTGESTLRDSNGYGNGVYKTTNGGANWTPKSHTPMTPH